jgi:hypothetical protein
MKFTPDDLDLFTSVTGRERLKERREFIKQVTARKGSPKLPLIDTKLFLNLEFLDRYNIELNGILKLH